MTVLRIPHSRPQIDADDERAVLECLRDAHLTRGRRTDAFEELLARVAGRGEAVALSTGHAALHLALLALGVGEGDRVVLPSYACAALLNAVRYCGAEGVIADCDPATGNLDPASVRRVLTPGVKALVAAHMFGLPAPIEELLGLGVPVIEDCAQTLGNSHLGRPVGSWGAVSVFSFYATKVAATGQGGALATDDPELAALVRDLVAYDEREDYRVRYNYLPSDLASALGASQLSRLEELVGRRRALAARYREGLAGLGLELPPESEEHMYFRFTVGTDNADELAARLTTGGVEAKRPVYRPIHRYLGFPSESFPGAERAHRRLLSIPLYPALTDEEAGRVVAAVQEAAS